MPKSAPAKVRISPKAVRTEGSILPVGGTKNATEISATPKVTRSVARKVCSIFLWGFVDLSLAVLLLKFTIE